MIHGILKRMAGDKVAERRVYEGLKDRQRFFALWSTFADTTSIQIEPHGPLETRFKGRYRDGSKDRRIKRGPRKIADYKFHRKMNS